MNMGSKIACGDNFVGPDIHEGFAWVSNASRDEEWANLAIVEGRLIAGPARATANYSSTILESRGIVGMYRKLPVVPTLRAVTATPNPESYPGINEPGQPTGPEGNPQLVQDSHF